MLKKILATALAAAMILGLASVALAASFSDTADSAKESSIQRLAGLGLLIGYPDGTFRPDNTITRAEFAKVICHALGLEDAADMLTGVPVGFSDVPANHWAVGYISVASSQDIVNGYPDGTYRPEANVSYAEAVTMIMRALGYEPILKNGTWPTAYLTKAASLGVQKGVSFNAAALATRGNVAALVANALTIGRLVEVGYLGDDVEYGVDEDSTLLTLMGAEKAVGWLTRSPELFGFDDEDGIVMDLTADFGDFEADEDDPEEDVEFDLADDTDYAGLLGHKVTAWLNNDGEVFFIEDESGNDAGVADVDDANELEFDGDDYDIDFYADADVFENYEYAGVLEDLVVDLLDYNVVEVVTSGDEIVSLILLSYEFDVVDSVNTTYDRVTFKTGGSERFDDCEITWSGAAEDLADLEEDDVVQYIMNDDEDEAVIIVTRNAVTGDFTRINADDDVITVDGTKYDWVGDVDDLADLGDEVTILLNMYGEAIYMISVQEDDAEEYVGIVVALGVDEGAWGDTGLVRLFNAAGETLELSLTDDCFEDHYDDEADPGEEWDLEIGDIVEYELDDEELDSVTVLASVAGNYEAFDVDDDDRILSDGVTDGINNPTVKVSSSTVIFNMSGFVEDDGVGYWDVGSDVDEDDLEVASLTDLLSNDTVTGIVYAEGAKATIVAMFDLTAETDTYFGWVTGLFEEEDDMIAAIIADGSETEYVYDDEADWAEFLVEGEVVNFEVSGDEIVEAFDIEPADYVVGEDIVWRVTDIDEDVLEIAQFYTEEYLDAHEEIDEDQIEDSEEYLLVDGDTAYFYDDEAIDLDDISMDSIVTVYMNGDVVGALVVEE